MKNALILNSRQSLRPIGTDRWIVNSQSAVEYAAANGYRLLSSVGMNSWEIPLFFASKLGAYQKICIPSLEGKKEDEIKDYYIRQFCLDEKLVEWEIVNIDESSKWKASFRINRDIKILHDAQILFPVSIRPRGNLDSLLSSLSNSDLNVMNRFITKYESRPRACKINIDLATIARSVDEMLDGYIIHWTKATSSPWPGETLYRFYEDVYNSKTRYARSGLETLKRILTERRLRSSAQHYRRNMAAVPFSDLKPTEAIQLMRWRARYQGMTFEPYGIGIRKEFTERLGIRKVLYGNPEMFQYLEKNDQPYFQAIGTKGFWIPEKEYRHIGDLDLRLIPNDMIIIIVASPDEISQLGDTSPGKIIPLFKARNLLPQNT